VDFDPALSALIKTFLRGISYFMISIKEIGNAVSIDCLLETSFYEPKNKVRPLIFTFFYKIYPVRLKQEISFW
jgi:hypothetical protein